MTKYKLKKKYKEVILHHLRQQWPKNVDLLRVVVNSP